MLTIEQCRGARGLLGWTQQDLADASGLSKTAINNFEKGHSDIKAESLKAIRMAFESADIELINHNGVRKKSEHARIIRGKDVLAEILDDISETLKGTGGDILISNVDNSLSSQISTQRLFSHIEMLKNHDIQEKILCVEGTKNVLSPNDECRWIKGTDTENLIPTFIYGTKVAFQLWDKSMFIIINSSEATNIERKRFERLWSHAEIPNNKGKSLKLA